MKKLVTITNGALLNCIGQVIEESKDVTRVSIGGSAFKFKKEDFRESTFEEICKHYLGKKTFVEIKYTTPDDMCIIFDNNFKIRRMCCQNKLATTMLIHGDQILATNN